MKRVYFTDSEIEGFNISHLKVNPHGEFSYDILEKAKATPAIVQNLPQQLARLEAAVEQETRSSFKDMTDSTTELIYKELVPKRDKVETALKSGFRAQMESDDAAVAQAAGELFELTHLHRLHTDMETDAQTDAIRDFIADVRANHIEALRLTGFEALFAKLEAANDAVCDAMAERVVADSSKVVGAGEEARAETDEAYRELVKAVNAFAYVQGAEGYAEFITFANALIRRYKRVHLKEKVQSPEAAPGQPTVTIQQ